MHLDLSGMILGDHIRPLLVSIDNQSISGKSKLVCLHLNDNEFSTETLKYICKKFKLEQFEAETQQQLL